MASSEEYGNRSVMAGFTLLTALASIGHAATLSEVAEAVKMTASRTHRFLAGLQKAGAVTQDPISGKYDLGPGLIELGVTALGRVDIVRRAIDTIGELAQATGLVSLVAAWGSNGPTVIKWTQGNRISTIHVPEGVNLPLMTTATGNIFLVYLARGKTKRFLEQEIKSANHSKKSLDEEIERITAGVKANGVAYSSGKAYHNFVKLAAPVFQWNGDLALVLTLIGDSAVTDMNETSPIARQLKEAADRLSQLNGCSPPRGQAGKRDLAIVEKSNAA
jgi:DNA-binding IclR family transcriptional regulator